jgi:TRAP-type mannitol/chloroaromatic compound transport system permease large subunit
MSPFVATAGGWMLLLLGWAIIRTGLPVWALLLACSSLFALGGLLTGTVDAAILGAVPARIVGLLEHDLLQALPLYVLVGVLLQRLTVADAVFSVLARALAWTGAGPALATLGTGALLAPMNGSVASTSSLMARLVGRRLAHLPPAQGVAVASVASTIGVVVPPSLVLILLGDAMLRAHTEAGQLAGSGALAGQRIINTQDVFHAALVPAALVLLLWLLVAAWRGRRSASVAVASVVPVSRNQRVVAGLAVLLILGLLASVFTGVMQAVEAAAAGGCLLVLAGWAQRSLSARVLREVLSDTLALSGALMALLVGATTFSLVFRAFGTDKLLSAWFGAAAPANASLEALAILALVVLCAWVLDAFEMIFVIIPILAPLLILRLGDAQQAAVLLLLVLQLGFLLPPMGYAVILARAQAAEPRPKGGALLRALLPFLMAQVLVMALVFGLPGVVHLLDASPRASTEAPATEQDIVRQLEDMARQPSADEDAVPGGSGAVTNPAAKAP